MNRVSNRHQLRLITEVPVTPLLNLVLVLLFVFLVAAPLVKQDATPAASDRLQSRAPESTVTLAVGLNAKVALDGAAMPLAELPAALAKLTPETGVIVQTPRDFPVHRLVEIMATLKAANIRHTAVMTAAGDGGS